MVPSAGGPGFNRQSKTASYQRRYKMVPVVPLFSAEHSKGKYWLFLNNKDRKINVMDKIWDKKKVIGCCGGDEKKTNDHAEPTKVER